MKNMKMKSYVEMRTKSFVAFIIVLLMTSVMLIATPISPVQAQLAASQPVSGPLPSGAHRRGTGAGVRTLTKLVLGEL
jgi:hypothetical protein